MSSARNKNITEGWEELEAAAIALRDTAEEWMKVCRKMRNSGKEAVSTASNARIKATAKKAVAKRIKRLLINTETSNCSAGFQLP